MLKNKIIGCGPVVVAFAVILTLLLPPAGHAQSGALATLPVDDYVTLRLVAALTAENPHYVTNSAEQKTHFLIRRFIYQSPAVNVWLNDYGFEASATNLGPSDIKLLFLADVPLEWKSDPEVSNRITETLADADFYLGYADFGNGYHSPNPSQLQTAGSDTVPVNVAGVYPYELTLEGIPATLDSFELVFVSESAENEVARMKVQNPLHRKVTPLQPTHKIPATIEHDGISVTLKEFASGISTSIMTDDAGESSVWESAQQGRYVQASGNVMDARGSAMVVEISDASTSGPRYAVSNVRVRYGQEKVEWDKPGWMGPLPLSNSMEQLQDHETHPLASLGEKDILFCLSDLSLVKQPVELSLSLVRTADYSDAEVATIDLPLPGTGKYIGPRAIKFGDEYARVWLANQGAIKIGRSEIPQDSGITVAFKAARDLFHLEKAELRGHDKSPLDITAAHSMYGSEADDELNIAYFTGVDAPLDIDGYTTLSLKCVAPRPLDKTFDFVLEPKEASILAGPEKVNQGSR